MTSRKEREREREGERERYQIFALLSYNVNIIVWNKSVVELMIIFFIYFFLFSDDTSHIKEMNIIP